MESLSEWILAISGIALIGIIVDIILPEGQIQKYCRNIFGLIMLLVIITPLPGLINKNYDFSFVFRGKDISIDENYVEEGYKSRLRLLERSCTAELEEHGYKNVVVSITVNEYTQNMTIVSVYADTSRIEFTEKAVRANYSVKVVDHIADFLKISRSIVSANG